ncbi:hypothetical protein [Paenibacillus sp. 481]|uniref:hypothetical protein n=1 Tax=Paenibacillus sp. 481 TaxID=2835869 RepID=UPI001E651D08|nr:hypothetical protein [Paenibacillus sp. 481]UHA73682.1 hypothetical protein KIK04_00440 [Paenibacillus sp. 481]
MLISIEKQDFEALDRSRLWKWCMEPTILQVRGKNAAYKAEVYGQLTPSQQALFMFSILHDHADNAADMYWYVSYYMSDLKAWPGIKRAAQFFENDDLLSIYKEMEQVVEAKNRQADGTWRAYTISDLDNDSELCLAVGHIYKRYTTLTPTLIEQINRYIEQNPSEFVRFV